jgi:hypothetical protein
MNWLKPWGQMVPKRCDRSTVCVRVVESHKSTSTDALGAATVKDTMHRMHAAMGFLQARYPWEALACVLQLG